jgi:glycosyltransferase involved in cell wall biosynthesis
MSEPDPAAGVDPALAVVRARRRVLVHHPGSNHLAYELVAGLQAGGYACDFETGFFFVPDGALARLVESLPTSLRRPIERELKRRSHRQVDARRLHLNPSPELAYVAANRLGISGERLARIVGWRNDVIDTRVARRVRRERPDFVVGHDGSALYAGRAAREVGAVAVLNQVVGHVEAALDLFAEEAKRAPEFAETMPRLPAAIVERHCAEIAEAERILVPSDYVRQTLVARGADPERIAVLPYGVDVTRFRPVPRRADRPFRLLFVGSLSQRKGIKYLLEAVRRLALADAELVLAGRMVGSAAAFRPYDGRFRHVAHVPYHEVHALYRHADVFVFPSLHEGSAFATYEALASGLPVVTTANSGSVVRDGEEGFLVPIRDVDAIADRILRLYRDPDLRRAMGEKARRRAEAFTWGDYRQRLNALFDDWAAG